MKCEDCPAATAADAVIHLTEIDRKTRSKKETHLCEPCAAAKGVVSSLESDEAEDARLNHSYKLGISSGWEAAGAAVRACAVDAFRAGDDKLAKHLRGIGDTLIDRGEKAHPGRTP